MYIILQKVDGKFYVFSRVTLEIRDTYENSLLDKKLLEKHGYTNLVIVRCVQYWTEPETVPPEHMPLSPPVASSEPLHQADRIWTAEGWVDALDKKRES